MNCPSSLPPPDTLWNARAPSGEDLAELVEHAPEMSFQGLVSYLERIVPPSTPAIGELGPVARERIRFRHDGRFLFHSGDVASLRWRRTPSGDLFEVETTFLGVVGTVSPLATFFTEELLRNEDDARARFYDLFHHRLLSLFVRASRRSVPGAALTREGSDATTLRLLSLAGLPRPRPPGPGGASPAFPSRAAIPHLRLFAQRPGSRDAVLTAFALVCPDLPIASVAVPAREIELDEERRSALGQQHSTLGEIVLGNVLVGQPGLLRLGAGPAESATLQALLPGGELHQTLARTLDQAAGGLLDVDLDISVAHGDEPPALLGTIVLGEPAMLAAGDGGIQASVRITFPSGDAPASVTWSATVEHPASA